MSCLSCVWSHTCYLYMQAWPCSHVPAAPKASHAAPSWAGSPVLAGLHATAGCLSSYGLPAVQAAQCTMGLPQMAR